MNVTTIGIDLAKNIFQLHGVDKHGKAVLRKRLNREELLPYLANLPPCLIGIEASGGAHYWGREIRKLGHDVKMMPPQYVKPYVKNNKNDYNDAEGICEAVSRPNMRFVPIKTEMQQEIMMMHRMRSQLIQMRTAHVNQLRGFLLEYGVAIPRGIERFRAELPGVLAALQGKLSSELLNMFEEMQKELARFDEQIHACDKKVAQIGRAHPVCKKLMGVEGIGPLTSSAVVGSVADPASFRNGRQFAAWLGVVPRQHSSGGKTVLQGISKRGDVYLRTLLIHGARAVVAAIGKKMDARSQWIRRIKDRRGFNVATVALANKNARILWALMTRDEEYRTAGA
jgi:transposase